MVKYDTKFIYRYKEILLRMTSITMPEMKKFELEKAIDYSIEKRFKDSECIINNNYTKSDINMYLSNLTNFILEREPICCSSGVMFKKHGRVPNPLIEMIQTFMDNRGIHKKQMFQYPKGSEMYEKYNLLQLLDKIDCNGIYGILAQPSALLYNINVAKSITMTGQSLISSATMFFEMFLSNNVKFASLDEIIFFINNIITEDRHYKDKEILDRDISVEECFSKIVLTTGDFRKGRIKWIPDEKDLNIIWNTLCGLSQENINRIYYKNNLYEFMNNTSMNKSLVYILSKLEYPFMDPNEPPSVIKVELDTLLDILKEFVYYRYQIMDRVDRCDNMIKNVCAISDTDSAIVSLDGWYRYTLDKIKGIPLVINRQYLNIVEYADKDDILQSVFYDDSEPEFDYNFISDEIVEMKRMIKPLEYCPADNLRYSIINIMAYIAGELVNDYMIDFTQRNNSYSDNRKCMIYMKNEFLFRRVLLTNKKKNYASIQELQEGNIVPKHKALDIKGLAMKKSTVNKATQKDLELLLEDEVLRADTIDQVRIIKKLAVLEKQMYQSLASGDKKYYKPLTIKSYSNYDNPLAIQGIKASMIWNAIKDDDLESIDINDRNTIDIVKVNINEQNIERVKDTYPELYDKLVSLMKDESIFKIKNAGKLSNDITSLAIPTGVKTPEWVMEFIDYKSIIKDNLSNFPLDSINIKTPNNDNIVYSNIMKI